jgi:hypothetical protein
MSAQQPNGRDDADPDETEGDEGPRRQADETTEADAGLTGGEEPAGARPKLGSDDKDTTDR